MTTEPEREHGHVTIDLGDRPFVRVVIPRTGNAEADTGEMRLAIRSLLAALDVDAEDVPAFKARLRDAVLAKTPPPAAAPARRGQSRGTRRQANNDDTPIDEECDNCGASPVYLKAAFTNRKTRKRISARVVCTNCKDGQYDHLIRWVDDEESY